MTTNTNKATTKTSVATAPKGGAIAEYDYAQYAGAGFENHGSEDYATPFLGILQSNSPQIDNIVGAKAGMLINTVTNTVYDGKKGIAFIPAHTDHVFVEWTPRDLGGGFVAIHQLNSDIVKQVKAEQEFGKYKMKKGDVKSNDLIETYYVYGILVNDDNTFEQLIITFTSTKNKIYKQWMTKARTIQIALPDGRRMTAPLFAHRYRINTINQKNSKGSFFNFAIACDGENAEACRISPKDELFQAAVAFRDFAQAGKVKAAHETQVEEAEEEAETPFK